MLLCLLLAPQPCACPGRVPQHRHACTGATCANMGMVGNGLSRTMDEEEVNADEVCGHISLYPHQASCHNMQAAVAPWGQVIRRNTPASQLDKDSHCAGVHPQLQAPRPFSACMLSSFKISGILATMMLGCHGQDAKQSPCPVVPLWLDQAMSWSFLVTLSLHG